jgi:non-ribosomal peptide synthetase component E (peptide arylation enzyme)
VPKAVESVTLDDITTYLQQQHIAVIKLPERLHVVEALPRNPLGKVMRNQLKQLLLWSAVSTGGNTNYEHS